MTTEENKALAHRFYKEVINKANFSLAEELLSPEFRDRYAPLNQPQGIEGFRQLLTMVATAFPDVQVNIDELVAEGDRVVARLTVTGTHTGVLMGTIQPTGKRATWTGIDILIVKNGQIAERWSQRDLLGLVRQLGVVKE
ncbi:MAG TPA: ester cyclase [Bacteroidota bacterium]